MIVETCSPVGARRPTRTEVRGSAVPATCIPAPASDVCSLALSSASARTNSGERSQGSNRVNWGGSWNNSARNCRSAYRHRNTPANPNNNLGFRLALVPPVLVAGPYWTEQTALPSRLRIADRAKHTVNRWCWYGPLGGTQKWLRRGLVGRNPWCRSSGTGARSTK